jgi:hypothetical protein
VGEAQHLAAKNRVLGVWVGRKITMHIGTLERKAGSCTATKPALSVHKKVPTVILLGCCGSEQIKMRSNLFSRGCTIWHIPLPGVLLYIRDNKTNSVLRILKTNPHGVFATFNPLQDGEYVVEIVDSSGGYLFDKTTITINNQTRLNFEFTSKETI